MSREGRPLDDDGLVGRAQRGDIGAYEELVRRYQSLAVRVAYLAGGSTSDAEDAAQEGFVRAYGALHRFRLGEPFRPWLLRIVANQARNQRRSARRRDQLALRASVAPSGDAAPSPEGAAVAAGERQAVLAALDRLPGRERLVISMRYLAELSEAETATVLGLPRGTIKSRTARGLARLRRLLDTTPERPRDTGQPETADA